MKKLLSLITMNLILSQSVLAGSQFEKKIPFQVTGSMTHFYGGHKSAEADMWLKALQVCQNLSVGENNALLLNRLSEVVFSKDSGTNSIAQATFVCLPVGMAN